MGNFQDNNYQKPRSHKGIIGFFVTLILFGTILISYQLAPDFIQGILKRNFPELQTSKQITLSCNYRGEEIKINETLYKTVDDFYGSEPKKRKAFSDSDHLSFVFNYEEDSTLKNLALNIKSKGKERGLTEDQVLDLANCFVQSIPYDYEKARKVLSYNPGDRITRSEMEKILDRYPYETLYDNKGICTDKSYLTSALAKELGYGASLLVFDSDQHMAVGIKTLASYSSFNSGYSYIETTNTGYKVGQLPYLEKESGLASKLEINFSKDDFKISGADKELGSELIPQIKEGNISNPSIIIKVSDGNDYKRIIELKNTENRIKELINAINLKNQTIISLKEQVEAKKEELNSAQKELDKAEEEVAYAESVYKKSSTSLNYNNYIAVYNSYKAIYNKVSVLIKEFNSLANSYNNSIEELNKYINEYNELIKE